MSANERSSGFMRETSSAAITESEYVLAAL
jgi:hypothetical protein